MRIALHSCPARITNRCLVTLHTGKLHHLAKKKKILRAIIYGHIPKCSEKASPSATTPISSWTLEW